MAEMNLCFPNPAQTSGAEIFAMEETHRLTEDLETMRGAMIDFLDIINYENGNSFDDPLQTRHAMAYMAAAMPSLAYIDPHKTREMGYNLGLVVDNINSYHLLMRMVPYSSDNLQLVEWGLACALYRLVSGRVMHDAEFHESAERIYDLICENGQRQHVFGIDSRRGSFTVAPNAMALLVLEIHDTIFGTRYLHVKDDMLTSLIEKLWDPQSGLWFESYQTGSIGYKSEHVNPATAWHTNVILPGVNALAIAFMNHFDPKGCTLAWERFKSLFMDSFLAIDAETVAESVGLSYNTQLGPGSEDLLAAMLAAKEMGDLEAFDALQAHLFEIGQPHMWEGHFTFTEFGELEYMVGYFALFARAHVGWDKLLAHDWAAHYEDDYVVVR